METYEIFSSVRNDQHDGWTIPKGLPSYCNTYSAPGRWGPYKAGPDTWSNNTSSYVPSQTAKSPKMKWGGSFAQKKKSGQVHMTNYFVSTVKIEDTVAARQRAQFLRVRTSCSGTTACHVKEDTGLLTSIWQEQRHLAGWLNASENPPPLVVCSRIDEEDVNRAIDSTRSRALSDALAGYDLLTELAEAPEALRFVSSATKSVAGAFNSVFANCDDRTRRLAFRMTPRQLLRSIDRKLRGIGSAWMAYRYAIMPLVYSYKEIMELLEKGESIFKTYRAKDVVIPRTLSSGDGAGTRILLFEDGNVTVRSTVKMGFTSGPQAFAQGVSMNPFKTAWELIPLSFVADWFVNIGDYITAKAGIDLSSTLGMCTAVKRSLTRTYVLADTWSKEVAYPGYSAGTKCGFFPATPASFSTDTRGNLRTVAEESYTRTVFDRGDIRLTLNSSIMDWKRAIDAAVLSYQTSRKILRSF